MLIYFYQLPYHDAPKWDSLGLLWRITNEEECGALSTPPPTPNSRDHAPKPKPALPYGQVESVSQTRWFVNPPQHLLLSTLHMTVGTPSPIDTLSATGSSFCIIEPSKLLQIQFDINALQGGIAGIRFRGTPEMGTVTFNSWPDMEGPRTRRMEKMKIDGT